MRRSILVVALLLTAAFPATAAAESYQYLTTYVGTYDFSSKFRAQEGKPDGFDVAQKYTWAVFDYHTITVRSGNRYTAKDTRYIAAKGSELEVNVQGSGQEGGPFTKTRDCTIASELTPVIKDTIGTFTHAIPVRNNPLVPVGWELPDYGGGPQANDAPKFTVTGSPECQVHNSSFVRWTIGSPTGGLSNLVSLVPTQTMREAFSGATHIRYSAFRNRPWERHFRNVTIQDTGSGPNGATAEGKVVVDSTVTFDRIDDYKPNKIGALLMSSGFMALSGQGTPDGPAGTSGDDETVIIPGLGLDQVQLDIQGVVTPQARSSRAQAPSSQATVLLARGSTRVGRGSRMARLTISPTAEGRRIFRAAHGQLAARYVLTVSPRGSTKTVSKTQAITVPPRVTPAG